MELISCLLRISLKMILRGINIYQLVMGVAILLPGGHKGKERVTIVESCSVPLMTIFGELCG